MPYTLIAPILNLLFVLGALFALWKGGVAERSAAVVVIVNVIIGEVGKRLAVDNDAVIRLINDGLAALVLLAVTIRFGALWMGGVMLFFAAQFSLHSFYLVTDRASSDYAHAMINNIDWSAINACLIIGTAVAWRARVRRARADGPLAT
jgi:hypothetical protein